MQARDDELAPEDGHMQTDAQGWVPSNTHPPNTRIVASGCDTLYISVRGRLREKPRVALEAMRERALSPSTSSPTQPASRPLEEFHLGNLRMAYHAMGQHGARHRLTNEDMTIVIHPNGGQLKAMVRVQLRSCFLWGEGWYRAILQAERLAASLLEDRIAPESSSLSRVDLCADFQGWIPRRCDEKRFVTRARHESQWKVNGRFTGFSFGKGHICCRIYNKSVEILNSGKGWMECIWMRGEFSPQEPVWRLEFQLRREALREMSLECISDLKDNGQSLWTYCTNRWIRLVFPREGARKERCPTDPAWASLQKLPEFTTSGVPVVRSKSVATKIEAIVKGSQGYLTSYAALAGHANLDITMLQLKMEIKKNMARADLDFSDLVHQKAIRKGLPTF